MQHLNQLNSLEMLKIMDYNIKIKKESLMTIIANGVMKNAVRYNMLLIKNTLIQMQVKKSVLRNAVFHVKVCFVRS